MERDGNRISNCVTLARSDDPLTLRWDPAHGSPRRTTFRNADAPAGYRRREWEWTGCQWRAVGQESVDGVVVENTDER
jgi:hypothetical protein